MPRFTLPHRQLELLQGDITTIPADAIVNAANSRLAGGGGVDGAIHRAGGPQIMRELDQIRARIGSCPTGSAVVTAAGRLPARFVFHAVGPVYHGGQNSEPELLAGCYCTCLDLAAAKNLASITFPSISTGIYGYPIAQAAAVALKTIQDWSSEHPLSPSLIQLIQFSPSDHSVYVRTAESLLGTQSRVEYR